MAEIRDEKLAEDLRHRLGLSQEGFARRMETPEVPVNKTSPESSDPTVRLSLDERAHMKDFWELYEKHYDEVLKDLLAFCETLPQLSAVLKQMSQEQMDEQNRSSRELMRRAVLQGEWAPLLADQRKQGAAYAAMGVSFAEWFDVISAFQKKLLPYCIEEHIQAPQRLASVLTAMNRYLDIAMSAIADEYLKVKEQIITRQQDAIQELSTPVLQIKDRMLLVPIIGMLDTHRARLLTEQLLHAIRTHRARVVVVDITGVPAVDSKVANHLFQTVAAARLMGARTVVTGLSADVAQALVTLGVDVEKLNTVGDLQGGLEEAERLLSHRTASVDAGDNFRAE